MRRLLILTYHFPPSAACGTYRMVGFCNHLPEHDWRTLVIAPPTLPWEPVESRPWHPDTSTTTVIPAPYSTRLVGKPIRKLFPYAAYLPRLARVAWREAARHRPDAVLTSGPPHGIHWIGLALKKRFGIPWIADYRDPWSTDAPLAAGRITRRARAWAEQFLLGRADASLLNTAFGCANLKKKYPHLQDRLVVVPNGFDPNRFPAYSPPPKRDTIRLTYTGELYNGRDPRPFLDAVKQVRDSRQPGRRPLEVSLVGRLDEGGAITAEEVRKRGLEGVVRLVGQVPYEESLQRMRDADLLLILNAPSRPIGIHAKLYEYLGAGRPILALIEAEGDMAWVLRQTGAPHRLASPGDGQQIARALEELLDEVEVTPPPPAPSERLAAFTRSNMVAVLAGTLDRLTEPRQSAPQRELAGAGRSLG